MNYTILMLATLMFCSLPSVLGIMCKKCTPQQVPPVLCDNPGQITEVNCDQEVLPSNSSGAKFDSCTIAKIVGNLAGTTLPTYAMECAVKDNSSDPAVVNCTSTEMRICADAQSRVVGTGITIISCNAKCCTENNCNVRELIEPTQPETTAGSTTTAKGGVSQIQPPLLGCLLIFVTVLFKELDERF